MDENSWISHTNHYSPISLQIFRFESLIQEMREIGREVKGEREGRGREEESSNSGNLEESHQESRSVQSQKKQTCSSAI